MPYLTIRYGPYKCHGIIDHRFQKINGLFRALDRLGYEIEVIPVDDFNRLSIEMFEREVFRCDIRNLMFNMPADDDPVCQRALRAVDEANRRMSSESNIRTYTATDNGMRGLSETAYNPTIKDNLPSQTDLLFEIKSDDRKCSLNRHPHDIAPEEKVSKVKIMEDKNTTFGLERKSEQGTIDEDY